MVKTLVMFSAIMVAFPIGTFFAFYDFIFLGESVVMRALQSERDFSVGVDEKVLLTPGSRRMGGGGKRRYTHTCVLCILVRTGDLQLEVCKSG